MWCPECRAEYREGYERCADCGVELTDELPPPEAAEVTDLPPDDDLVEYPLDELSADQRKLLDRLLTRAEVPFGWEHPNRLVVARASADAVDEILDIVDESAPAATGSTAVGLHDSVRGHRHSGDVRRGKLVDKIIEVLEAKWLILIGLVIVVAGVVDLIWTQISVLPGGAHLPIGYRWDIATAPLQLIALGILVIVGAQIMVAVQDTFLRDAHDAPVGEPGEPTAS